MTSWGNWTLRRMRRVWGKYKLIRIRRPSIKILSSRSFLLFPLSLTIPGKGRYRKLLGFNKTCSGRPVYNHTETGERIFFRGLITFGSTRTKIFNQITENLWHLCSGCDYKDSRSDIGAVRSLSSSLMIPRLTFNEWEGLESIAGSCYQIGSRVFKYF